MDEFEYSPQFSTEVVHDEMSRSCQLVWAHSGVVLTLELLLLVNFTLKLLSDEQLPDVL